MNLNFLDSSIDDLEFAKRFTAAMKELEDTFSPEDFKLNPIQYKKFNDLVVFFKKAAKDLGGKIDSTNIQRVFGVGDLTATFEVFDLAGDDIQRFCDVIRSCSAISMDVTSEDKICISCTVPDVFILK